VIVIISFVTRGDLHKKGVTCINKLVFYDTYDSYFYRMMQVTPVMLVTPCYGTDTWVHFMGA